MTSGQIEAIASEVVNRFLQQAMGRGPSSVNATLIPRGLVVRMSDVLTPAEACLTKRDQADPAQAEAIVREMRDRIVRASRLEITASLRAAIGRQASAVLHDLDPASGEEMMLFTFSADPAEPAGDHGHRPRRDRRTSA